MQLKNLLWVVLANLFISCSFNAQPISKINGVSFVASKDSVSTKHIQPVVNVNANYAAVMPFGFIRDLNTPEVHFNSKRQWFGETVTGMAQYIDALNNNGIAVMLKPQIWVFHGVFTGHIKMETESKWLVFEQTYRDFILEFAQLAEQKQVPVFCIGTELEAFINARPRFWKALIQEVKSVYSGKLTYAANWDEYSRVPFWDDLDYIGVDAYFPLTDEKTPSLEKLKSSWMPYKSELKTLSNTTNKPILFTEFGYRSVDYTAKEPWKSDRSSSSANLDAQHNATKGLFNAFWDEPWFAGGFIWKWFINHDAVGGVNNNRFTPQNKPTEQLIETFYGKYAN